MTKKKRERRIVKFAPKAGKIPLAKIKAAVRKVKAERAEAEENSRMPMCRICDHRHSGVAHVWK